MVEVCSVEIIRFVHIAFAAIPSSAHINFSPLKVTVDLETDEDGEEKGKEQPKPQKVGEEDLRDPPLLCDECDNDWVFQ
jgi:hypothetical protein